MTDTPGNGKDEKGRLAAILKTLTPEQIRFLTARMGCVSDREAARQIGINIQAPYKWRIHDVPIDEALSLLEQDSLSLARHLRKHNLAKAMQAKIDGLNSRDQRLRQAVATEIIEWEMGKAMQRQELTGVDGGPVKYEIGELSDREYAERFMAVLKSLSKDEISALFGEQQGIPVEIQG